MKRIILGALAAATAAFIWGFIFWGTPLGKPTFDQLTDLQEQAAMAALTSAFAADGAYQIPGGYTVDEATMIARMQQGPLATVYIQKAGGKALDPIVMLGGFLHMLVTALALAILLNALKNRLGGPFNGFIARKATIGSIGIIASFWSNMGKPIWFHQSWSHHAWVSVYDIIAIGLMAGILALVIKPDAAPAKVFPG